MAETFSTAALPREAALFARSAQKFKETDFVLDFLMRSNTGREPFLKLADEILENRLVDPDHGRGHETQFKVGSLSFKKPSILRDPTGRRSRSKLKSPKTAEIIDGLISDALGLLLGSPEFIQVMPVGSDDMEKARYLGRLLMRVLESPGWFRTLHELFSDAFTFGVAVAEFGWETRTRNQAVKREVLDPETGIQIGSETRIEEVVYRDAPMMRLVDAWDAYPDPQGTRIQDDMMGFAKRFRMSKQRALGLAEAGVFDKADVQRAVASGPSRPTDSGVDQERFPELTADTVEDYGVMTGFDWWGEVPFNSPGGRNRVITLLNGIRVRSSVNPYIDGNIPFKEFVPNPVPKRWWGLSPAEIVRFLQDSLDSLLMSATDSADMAARNIMLVRRTSGIDKSRLMQRLPGDVIEGGQIDDNHIRPLPFDTSTLQFALNEAVRRGLEMEGAAGSNNPQRALAGMDRAAATTTQEIVRLASQKTELMVRVLEKNDMPFVGSTIHSRLKQFLDPEREAILAGETFPVTLADVDFNADVRFMGSRQAMSKQQRFAVKERILNTLMAKPEAAVMYPKFILRMLRDDLGLPDAQEIVLEAQQAFQLLQQQQAQQEQQAQAAKNAPPQGDPTTDAGVAELGGESLA